MQEKSEAKVQQKKNDIHTVITTSKKYPEASVQKDKI